MDENENKLAVASNTLVLVNLFALVVCVLSVLSTKGRLLSFFENSRFKMPAPTIILLSMGTWEYIMMAAVFAMLLIAKERSDNNKLTLILNIIALISILGGLFMYIWAISLPFFSQQT